MCVCVCLSAASKKDELLCMEEEITGYLEQLTATTGSELEDIPLVLR